MDTLHRALPRPARAPRAARQALVAMLACTAACRTRNSAGAAAAPAPESAAARESLLHPDAPLWAEPAPERFLVRFATTAGAFVVEVHRAWAPRGADRFYHLVQTGFFDDSRIFRVRSGFIAQFGIPGDPAIAAVWRARRMPDDPVRAHNARGTIAYAMTGPDTRTTQLYINLADNTRLDAQGFAPIGRVLEGMDVVERLYAGYGEQSGGGMRAGRQDSLFARGNAYLDAAFPKLDRLLTARLVSRAP